MDKSPSLFDLLPFNMDDAQQVSVSGELQALETDASCILTPQNAADFETKPQRRKRSKLRSINAQEPNAERIVSQQRIDPNSDNTSSLEATLAQESSIIKPKRKSRKKATTSELDAMPLLVGLDSGLILMPQKQSEYEMALKAKALANAKLAAEPEEVYNPLEYCAELLPGGDASLDAASFTIPTAESDVSVADLNAKVAKLTDNAKLAFNTSLEVVSVHNSNLELSKSTAAAAQTDDAAKMTASAHAALADPHDAPTSGPDESATANVDNAATADAYKDVMSNSDDAAIAAAQVQPQTEPNLEQLQHVDQSIAESASKVVSDRIKMRQDMTHALSDSMVSQPPAFSELKVSASFLAHMQAQGESDESPKSQNPAEELGLAESALAQAQESAAQSYKPTYEQESIKPVKSEVPTESLEAKPSDKLVAQVALDQMAAGAQMLASTEDIKPTEAVKSTKNVEVIESIEVTGDDKLSQADENAFDIKTQAKSSDLELAAKVVGAFELNSVAYQFTHELETYPKLGVNLDSGAALTLQNVQYSSFQPQFAQDTRATRIESAILDGANLSGGVLPAHKLMEPVSTGLGTDVQALSGSAQANASEFKPLAVSAAPDLAAFSSSEVAAPEAAEELLVEDQQLQSWTFKDKTQGNESPSALLEEQLFRQIALMILHDLSRDIFVQILSEVFEVQGFTTLVCLRQGNIIPEIDLMASGGLLGFGGHKICVKIKYNVQPIDRLCLDEFSGLIKKYQADYGILISPAGFKRSFNNEICREFFDIHFWDMQHVVGEILKHYSKFHPKIQKLLPLEQMWILDE